MNTLSHLPAVLASLWGSVYAFQTLNEPALGGALFILFLAVIASTVSALDDDIFMAKGRKMLKFKGGQRDSLSWTSKAAIGLTVVMFALLTVANLDFLAEEPIGVSIASPTGAGGEVEVAVIKPHTAFGELAVAETRPIIQLQFPYSVNPRLVTTSVSGSGTATVANSLLTVATGATASSNSLLRSVLDAKYEPGQGMLARWTSVFQASGADGAEAISGIGNEEDFFGFGYQDTAFGILHRFAGKVEHQTLTISAGAGTASGDITITLDGRDTTVTVAQNDSAQAVARAIDAAAFSGWDTQAIGADVVFISDLAEVKGAPFAFDDTDTTGTAATFAETITGAAPTNAFIAQTVWNEDNLDGDGDVANPSGMNLDHDTGNVFQVQYQWLGFGQVLFEVENPATGRFVDVHRVEYANANTTPSIQNPTLPLWVSVKNGSSATNITVQTSSMAVFTEGAAGGLLEGLNNSAFGSATGDLTTETAILALKSKPIFQGVANRVQARFEVLSFSAVGAGGAKFTTLRAWANPILGGNPSFTDVDTATSIMAFDTSGTTVSGGNKVAEFGFGKNVESFVLDLTPFTGNVPPGTLIVITVELSGGTSDVDVSLIWRELF